MAFDRIWEAVAGQAPHANPEKKRHILDQIKYSTYFFLSLPFCAVPIT